MKWNLFLAVTVAVGTLLSTSHALAQTDVDNFYTSNWVNIEKCCTIDNLLIWIGF